MEHKWPKPPEVQIYKRCTPDQEICPKLGKTAEEVYETDYKCDIEHRGKCAADGGVDFFKSKCWAVEEACPSFSPSLSLSLLLYLLVGGSLSVAHDAQSRC